MYTLVCLGRGRFILHAFIKQGRKEIRVQRKHYSRHCLLGQSLEENSSEEEKQGSNLHSPGLAISTLKFTINEHSEEGRHQQSTTAKSITNGKSQLTSSRSITPVTEGQKEGRPDGRPSLLPGSMEPIRIGALLTLQGITHDDAIC